MWTALTTAIKQAAIRAGFSENYRGKFAGAIAELHDNAVELSQRVDTGYIAFDSSPGRFEFIVADRGLGVLDSLRNNPAYSSMSDASLALEAALTYGGSGSTKAGRGTGFKPMIEGLANIAHSMRFRSRDHSREYLRDDTSEIEARTAQKIAIDGFIVSVFCDASMV